MFAEQWLGDIEKGHFFITLDDHTFDKLTRVDPWKHEDRSSLGGDGLFSSWTLRFGDLDRNLIP